MKKNKSIIRKEKSLEFFIGVHPRLSVMEEITTFGTADES
jgi:hypothetical protein